MTEHDVQDSQEDHSPGETGAEFEVDSGAEFEVDSGVEFEVDSVAVFEVDSIIVVRLGDPVELCIGGSVVVVLSPGEVCTGFKVDSELVVGLDDAVELCTGCTSLVVVSVFDCTATSSSVLESPDPFLPTKTPRKIQSKSITTKDTPKAMKICVLFDQPLRGLPTSVRTLSDLLPVLKSDTIPTSPLLFAVAVNKSS